MSKERLNRTLRIKKRLVAITSVLLALTLMTTIGFNADFAAYAEGENNTETTQAAEQTTTEQTTTEQKDTEQTQAAQTGETQTTDTQNAEAAGETQPTNGTEAGTAQPAEQAPAEGGAVTEDEVDPAEFTDDIPTDLDYTRTASMPEVSSSSYIVMSGSTSEVVIKHHAQRKMSPGRMTMLMTAMVVLDNMYNDRELENTVEITDKIAEYGTSFKVGESVKVGDLLSAMLVGGSEEAAEALSRYSASKRKIFIKMMNSKAMELGLMDTQFANPTGEYSTKQYSTAADCAVIAQAAIRYQKIQKIFELPSVEFEVTSKDVSRAVGFRSTNPLLVADRPSTLYKYTKGGISGALGAPVKASQFAGIATVDDMQLIVILMDSKADKLAQEAKGLLEYGDTKVTKNVIVEANTKVGTVRIKGGQETKAAVYTATKGFAYVPPEGSEDLISKEVYVYNDLVAPVKDGDKVGEYKIYVADELKGTVDLIVKKNISTGWFPSQYYISNRQTVIICVVLALILLLVARILYVRWRKRKMREARRERKLQEIALQQLEIDEDRKRRNWTYTSSYDKVAPRTGDLRREAEEEAEKAKELKKQKRATRATRAERRKAAKARKTMQTQAVDNTTANTDKATRTVITDKPDE